jgi:hypothetical protein
MQALNAFDLTNFLPFTPGNGISNTFGANGTGFGQTSGAYRDLSNTNDAGQTRRKASLLRDMQNYFVVQS